MSSFKIRSACIEDTALILQMIRELADFEQLVDQVYKKIGATPMSEWTVFRLAEESINRLSQ